MVSKGLLLNFQVFHSALFSNSGPKNTPAEKYTKTAKGIDPGCMELCWGVWIFFVVGVGGGGERRGKAELWGARSGLGEWQWFEAYSSDLELFLVVYGDFFLEGGFFSDNKY